MKQFSIQKKYYPNQNHNSFYGSDPHQYKYFTPCTNKNSKLNQSVGSINLNKQRYQPISSKSKTPFKSQVKTAYENAQFQTMFLPINHSKEQVQSSLQKNMISNLRQQLNSLKSEVNKLIQKQPQSASKSEYSVFKKEQNAKLIQGDKLKLLTLAVNTSQKIPQISNTNIQNTNQRQKNQFHFQRQFYQQNKYSQNHFKTSQKKVENFQRNNCSPEQSLNKKINISFGNNSKHIQQKHGEVAVSNFKKCSNCIQYSKQVFFLKQQIVKFNVPDDYLQQIQHQSTKMKNQIANYSRQNQNLQHQKRQLQQKVKLEEQKNKQLRQINYQINEQLQTAKRMVQQMRLSVGLKNSLLDKFQSEIDELKASKEKLQDILQQESNKVDTLAIRYKQVQILKQKITQLQNDERRLLKDAQYWKSQYYQSNKLFNQIRQQIKNLDKKSLIKQDQLQNIKFIYRRILNVESQGKLCVKDQDCKTQSQKQDCNFSSIQQKQTNIQNLKQIQSLNSIIQSLNKDKYKLQLENASLIKRSYELANIYRKHSQNQAKLSQNQIKLQAQITTKDKLIHNMHKDLEHFQSQLKLNICLKNNYQTLITQLNKNQLQRKLFQLNQRFQHF